MTRRLIIEHSQSRSETIRTRLELSLDDRPVTNISPATGSPVPRVGIQVPRPDASATLGETENDR